MFLSLTGSHLGAYAFLLFAVIALASSAYVATALPETKGRTLLEIQALLAPPPPQQLPQALLAPLPPPPSAAGNA